MAINLYIVDHDHLEKNAPDLADNCSYWPGSWARVCDVQFVGRMLRLLEGKSTEPEPDDSVAAAFEQIASAKRAFLFEWLIAHEMGHLVLGHSKHDLARAWKYSGGVVVGQEVEKEADEFYISRLQHDVGRQAAAYFALSHLVTALYRQAVLAQCSKEQIERQVAKHGDDFIYATELDIRQHYRINRHPPILLRALILAELLVSHYPNLADDGYFRRIKTRIKLVAGGSHHSPSLPQAGTLIDDGKSRAPVPLLSKHALILLLQSAPQPWVNAILAKIRELYQRSPTIGRRRARS